MLTTAPFLDEPQELRRETEPEPEPSKRSEEERRAWYMEGVRSLEHYERTGLHVTWEEMEAWLKTCGTDHETEPPECHT